MSFLTERIMAGMDFKKIIDHQKQLLAVFLKSIDRKKIILANDDIAADTFMLGVPIYVKNREEFIEQLSGRGIACLTYYENWRYAEREEGATFKQTRKILKELVVLPLNYRQSVKDIEFMVKTLNERISIN